MAIHNKSMGNRLTRKQWQDIESMLKSKSKTIQQISDFYGISRNSIYAYGWRHQFIQKKSNKLSFLQRIKQFFKK